MFMGVFATLIIGLSSVAAAGYARGIEAGFGWGKLSRMAVHTAIGFMVFGTAAFYWLYSQRPSGALRWLPYSALAWLAWH